MIATTTIFFILAAIIVIGYLSLRFFEKTKIPDIIFLMLLGMLIGPVFNIFGSNVISVFKSTMPLFSALALIILLFEGGLHINFFRVLKSLSKATFFTVFVFVLTLGLIASFMHLLIGWSLLESVLLGAIVGGTSSAIVISLINKTSASEDTVMLLNLESSITDALCVITAFAIVGFYNTSEINISTVGQNILGAFSISAVMAMAVALIWLGIKRLLYKGKYEYLLTIAVLLFLYSFVEYFHANGAVAALVFGIVLGNAKEITTMLRFSPKDIDYKVVIFQEEISFFVRTFFFVYLGIVFELSAINPTMLAMAFAIIVLITTARYAGAKIITFINKGFEKDLPIIVSMMPRGLAAAVLASLPLTLGLEGHSKDIFYLTFLIIIISNMATTLGIFLSEKKEEALKNGKQAEQKIAQQLKEENIEEIKVKETVPETPKKKEAAKK